MLSGRKEIQRRVRYLFCFPQMELGPVATSYIPTSGTVVTRAADVILSDVSMSMFRLYGMRDIAGPDLQATLESKAASSHTHTITDITDLQTALDEKMTETMFYERMDQTTLQWESVFSKVVF
jgi:hypothetical protein